MEPELPLPGRDVTLTCNGVRGVEYEELYIKGAGTGICGLYIVEPNPNQNKCEKPTTTTCGIDPDILVTCDKSGTDTPFIKVTKKNLDTNDNGLWECFGTGSPALLKSVNITLGKYMSSLLYIRNKSA